MRIGGFPARIVVVAVAGALTGALVGGCSGGGTNSHRPPPEPTTSTSSTTTPPLVTVGKTVNYEDFSIHFLTADWRPSDNLLRLQVDVTNNLSSPQEFNPTFNVTSSGETYEGRAARNPTVAPVAAGTAPVPVPVELDVGVDQRFSMSDAVVIFGNTTKNQSRVPLGSGGTFVPLLDVRAPTPAPVTAGEQSFTFTSGTVSAYEYDGSELNAGTRSLKLTITVHNADPAHRFGIDAADMKFVNGAETLNSGTVRNATVNPGGSVDGVQFYADVDNYKAGDTVTITVFGADAQLARVSQQVTVLLPPLT